MTNRTTSSDTLEGWYDYGTHVTLLVRREVADRSVVKLMDVEEFGDLVRAVGSVPEVLAIGNDGKPHEGRHRIVDGVIAFHFPTGPDSDFGIDLPDSFTR